MRRVSCPVHPYYDNSILYFPKHTRYLNRVCVWIVQRGSRYYVSHLVDKEERAEEMTITLFISLFTLGSCVSAVFTEAVKKAFSNAGKEYSANVVALANSAVVGGLGTAVSYMLLNIPWTINNIICLLLMIVVVWMASMVGYDKIMQLLNQITVIKKDDKE